MTTDIMSNATVEKLIDELSKQIKTYNDIKQNCKYLIYFRSIEKDNFTLNVTDGVVCWQSDKLNEQLVRRLNSNINLLKFLSLVEVNLKRNMFELNKIDNDKSDTSIEIKLASLDDDEKSNSFQIILKLTQVKSNMLEMKKLVFLLADRVNKLEEDVKDAKESNANLLAKNSSLSSYSNDANRMTKSASSDILKRLNQLGGQSSGTSVSNTRKLGRSIVNPMAKKHKISQGVKYVDNDNDDDASNGS